MPIFQAFSTHHYSCLRSCLTHYSIYIRNIGVLRCGRVWSFVHSPVMCVNAVPTFHLAVHVRLMGETNTRCWVVSPEMLNPLQVPMTTARRRLHVSTAQQGQLYPQRTAGSHQG